jgi:tRNA(Glu) U13 pseudouridine synthase TruD
MHVRLLTPLTKRMLLAHNAAAALATTAAATAVTQLRFSYAGAKDKRAMSAQKVRCWRLEAEKLHAAQVCVTRHIN